MKNTFKFFCLLIVCVLLLGCEEKEIEVTNQKDCEVFTGGNYNLSFETNGAKETIEPINVCIACSPDTYRELPIVTKDGYIFGGWYYDKEFSDIVDIEKTNEIVPQFEYDDDGCIISYKDLVFYARWVNPEDLK